MRHLMAALLLSVLALGCGDDNESDRLGVGAECTMTDECNTDNGQSCLTQFKGGYCGVQGCTGDIDCPESSACITHTDSINYCFRTCIDKAECNANRTVDNESNCSANVTFVDGAMSRKACVPPSSGI
jgi:hypothetical protein